MSITSLVMAKFEKTEAVELRVELVCEELKSTEVVSLSLASFPTSFDDVKCAIEKSFSIPSFLQTLWVEGEKIDSLSVSVAPSQFHLRTGDTIKVSFPMKCDCKNVKEVIDGMSECLDIIHSLQSASSHNERNELFPKIYRLFHYDHIQTLLDDLFFPWNERVKYTNALYFDHLGGITSLVQIHAGIQSLNAGTKPELLHVFCVTFEPSCCGVFANFAMDAALRKRATEQGALDCGLKSFLRVTAYNPESTYVIEQSLMAICK